MLLFPGWNSNVSLVILVPQHSSLLRRIFRPAYPFSTFGLQLIKRACDVTEAQLLHVSSEFVFLSVGKQTLETLCNFLDTLH